MDPSPHFNLPLTDHARARMSQRGISGDAVLAALCHGRSAHVRGAEIFAIGRAEILRAGRHGIDLAGYEGVQVVCALSGAILTVYRNRDLRGLRPGPCRRAKRRARR